MECHHKDKPRQGCGVRPAEDIVRLSQKASTSFQGRALDSMMPDKGPHKYRLFCTFLGLLGTNGALPLHLTEYAQQRTRHHQDPAFAEFVDMFNHRMLSLFYRAIAEFDPAINLDRQNDNAMESMIAALGGYLPRAAKQRDSIPDYLKFFQAGWLGSQVKSPDGIVALIGQYFCVPVSVDEFTGDWLTLPESAQTMIGRRAGTAQLGVSTYLGRRAWSVGHKFTVVLGPLSWDACVSFKPGGRRARELSELMKNYVGDEWDWDVELVMLADKVQGSCLDRRSTLGFNAFLGNTSGRAAGTRSIWMNRRVLISRRTICQKSVEPIYLAS